MVQFGVTALAEQIIIPGFQNTRLNSTEVKRPFPFTQTQTYLKYAKP